MRGSSTLVLATVVLAGCLIDPDPTLYTQPDATADVEPERAIDTSADIIQQDLAADTSADTDVPPACAWSRVSSPATGHLYGLWGANDIWAVGASGTLQRYDSDGWAAANSPVGVDLHAVWGRAASDAWAVGAAGATVALDSAWSVVSSPSPQTLRGVHGCAARRVLTFLASADASVDATTPDVNAGSAALLHVDLAPAQLETFIRFDVSVAGTVTSAKLRLYSIDSSTDGPAIYSTSAGWSEGAITWNNRPAPSGSAIDDLAAVPLNDWVELDVSGVVTGSGSYDFVLVPGSNDGADFHSRENASYPLLVLEIAAPDDVWVVGEGGTILHHDGSAWSTVASPTASHLNAAGGCGAPGPGKVFGAAADAHVDAALPGTNLGSSALLYVDQGADQQQTFLRFDVSGVAGTVQSAKLRLYATNASTDGPALYSTTGGWSESAITWSNKPAPLGPAIQDMVRIVVNEWVEYDVTSTVAGDGSYDFVLVPTSTDGADFQSREGANGPQLVLVTGSALWGVGDGGAILRYEDGTWGAVQSPAVADLHGLWGDAGDVWAVGKAGTILRYDGAGWTASAIAATKDLHAVSGGGPNDIWAVGGTAGASVSPVIVHYDGSGWTDSVFSKQGLGALRAVWSVAACDVWAAGDDGALLHRAMP